MPQNDRHRPRIVPIESEAHETFENLPLQERVSIVFISNGKAGIVFNGKALTLTAPCVMLISQYDSLKLAESHRLEAKSFSFNPVFLNSSLTFERLKKNDFTEMEDEHDRNMMNLFLKRDEYYNGILELSANTYLRILEWMAIIGTEVYAQSDGYWTCRIRRYLLQILYLIEDIRMEYTNPQKVQKEKSQVDILLKYIHTNYSEDISLDLLCKLAHTNRTTLNRKFKAQTGFSAMEYLLRHRLKLACEALVHTNLSLSEISEAIGFKYDTYFIRQFTAKMGMSPTEYRHKSWV
jgi:AraC-like DNA-binding protein